MIAIAFVHNLLRRHPSCNILLHRPAATSALAGGSAADRPDGSAELAATSVQKQLDSTQDAVQNGHADRLPGQPAEAGAREGGSQQGEKPRSTAQQPRASDAGREGSQQDRPSGVDVYIASEEDPAESRAIESSLWEIESLRNHYCPQVSGPYTLQSLFAYDQCLAKTC